MLYVASDHHKSHLTVNVLDEAGQSVERRQISTHPEAVADFLGRISAASADQGGFICMFEECGFTLWFEQELKRFGCRKYVKIQPLKRHPQKTDRRDAGQIGELLWANRYRILAGERLLNVRQVESPSEDDRQARVLTAEIQGLRADRAAATCRIKDVLRRFNKTRDCPTTGLMTRAARAWLEDLPVPSADHAKIRRAVQHSDFLTEQIDEIQGDIQQRAEKHPGAQVLMTIPGVAHLTALAVVSRIGSIDRFPTGASLANFFGLAPGINDSGEQVGRIGSITKRGSTLVRALLGQVVYHVVRADADLRRWHRKIRARRGKKTAMVASMRRIACIMWYMLKTGETFPSVRKLSEQRKHPASSGQPVRKANRRRKRTDQAAHCATSENRCRRSSDAHGRSARPPSNAPTSSRGGPFSHARRADRPALG